MASKKINRELAWKIADKIAAKAFEHLITPVEAQYDEIATEAWGKFEAEFDFPKLAAWGIVGAVSSVNFALRTSRDASDGSDLNIVYTGTSYRGHHWETMRLVDDELHARMQPVAERLSTLRTQRNGLFNELYKQLGGKTTKQAMTAWPEATAIIAHEADVSMTVGFTVPLESLLAKFLPMLPAPTTQGG